MNNTNKVLEKINNYLKEYSEESVNYQMKSSSNDKKEAEFEVGNYSFRVIFLIPLDIDKDLDVERKDYWSMRISPITELKKAFKKLENPEKITNTIQKIAQDFIQQNKPEKMRLELERKVEDKYNILNKVISKTREMNLEERDKDGKYRVYFVRIK